MKRRHLSLGVDLIRLGYAWLQEFLVVGMCRTLVFFNWRHLLPGTPPRMQHFSSDILGVIRNYP